MLTLSVHGLNPSIKSCWLVDWLNKQDPSICCLQETCLTNKDRWNWKWKDGKGCLAAIWPSGKAPGWMGGQQCCGEAWCCVAQGDWVQVSPSSCRRDCWWDKKTWSGAGWTDAENRGTAPPWAVLTCESGLLWRDVLILLRTDGIHCFFLRK